MSRRHPKSSSLKRPRASQNAKSQVVVVCEGVRTEKAYLDEFAQDFGNGLVSVRPVPVGGAPITVVDRAIEEKKSLAKRARRSRDSFDKNYEVWAMFDRDTHPIDAAFDKAAANGIKVAFSNPCFELWGILHYEKHNAPDSNKEVQDKLAELMPGYHHKNSPQFIYGTMRGQAYKDAKVNAEWLRARRKEEQNNKGNPYTDVDILMKVIEENGKIKPTE
ncbi:MAG: RloB family protein [Desulfuromonadales bacterium]|nr:RloB family protein [Desulfuromonadales bacterium]